MVGDEFMNEIIDSMGEEREDICDRSKRGICFICGLSGEDCFCDVED